MPPQDQFHLLTRSLRAHGPSALYLPDLLAQLQTGSPCDSSFVAAKPPTRTWAGLDLPDIYQQREETPPRLRRWHVLQLEVALRGRQEGSRRPRNKVSAARARRKLGSVAAYSPAAVAFEPANQVNVLSVNMSSRVPCALRSRCLAMLAPQHFFNNRALGTSAAGPTPADPPTVLRSSHALALSIKWRPAGVQLCDTPPGQRCVRWVVTLPATWPQVVMLRHAPRRPSSVWSQRCDQSSVPGPVSANSTLNPSQSFSKTYLPALTLLCTHAAMAVHAQCLQNVSMATGTFASQLRGSRARHTSTAVNAAAGRQQRFCALSTYNRRADTVARQAGPLTVGLSAQSQGLGSSLSSFAGRPTLARLASHIGRPRFNALARLASTALGSRRSADAYTPSTGAHASAAVAERPTAAVAAPAQLVRHMTLLFCLPST